MLSTIRYWIVWKVRMEIAPFPKKVTPPKNAYGSTFLIAWLANCENKKKKKNKIWEQFKNQRLVNALEKGALGVKEEENDGGGHSALETCGNFENWFRTAFVERIKVSDVTCESNGKRLPRTTGRKNRRLKTRVETGREVSLHLLRYTVAWSNLVIESDNRFTSSNVSRQPRDYIHV